MQTDTEADKQTDSQTVIYVTYHPICDSVTARMGNKHNFVIFVN